MNVDNFKQHLISQTGKKGFAWKEYDGYKGEGCNIYTIRSLPNFPKCIFDVYLTGKSLEVVVQFDRVSNSADTLKLINDFNSHCLSLKAYIAPVKDDMVLFVSGIASYLADEASGVNAFFTLMDAIYSDETQIYLRPLTILAK